MARSGLSKRQLALRREGIGASEIAALAGVSKWATPIEIFEAKLNPNLEKDVTLPMELGIELEEPIARVYAGRTGLWLRPVDTIVHPTRKVALSTPDRAAWPSKQPALASKKKLSREEIQGCEKLVQIKSTNWRMREEWGEPGTDQVAEHYLCQGQWEMGVAGVPQLDFAVLFDKDAFGIYPLKLDQDLFETLCEIADRFVVDHILTGKPPPVDYTEKYSDFLARRYPGKFYAKKEKLDLIDATPEQVETVLLYAKLKEAGKRLAQLEGLTANKLRAWIGEKAGITSPDFGLLTWKRTKDSTRIDWQAYANEARMLAGQLLNTITPDEAGNATFKMSKAELDSLKYQLTHLETSNARTIAGYRRFYSKWAGQAALELGTLEMKLDRLEKGTETEEDEES